MMNGERILLWIGAFYFAWLLWLGVDALQRIAGTM